MKTSNEHSTILDKAVSLIKIGDRTAACNLLEDLLVTEPDCILAMHQLAMIYAESSEHIKSVELYKKIVELRPENLDAKLLLGVEYGAVGNFDDAIVCFYDCIANSPNVALFHKLAGVALSDGGKHRESLEELLVACKLDPYDDDALTRLAIEQIHFLKMGDGELTLLKALEINPLNPLAHNNLGRIYKFQGKIREAVAAFRKALEIQPENFVVADNLLLALNYSDEIEPSEVALEHQKISKSVYCNFNLDPIVIPAQHIKRPIRIGYVSGDFHNHSVSFFIEPVLMHHNQENVTVYCYSNGFENDATTRRFMGYNLNWRNISKISDTLAAKMIVDDEIDILVDLSGHSSGNRLGLFSMKPAKIAVSWLGYPHSTGLKEIDYYISDSLCDPIGLTDHLYTEKIIRLTHIFSCYLPPLEFPAVSTNFNKKETVTFGSFNNFAKTSDKNIEVWGEILNSVPNSQILLKSMTLGDPKTQKEVWDKFAFYGIAAERVALLNTVNSQMDHLSLYNQIDIALDTFPYNGTTTTCESLWMGTPVITLAGRVHASRVGVSLLTNVGLPELIAKNRDEYVAIAISIANNRNRIHFYRENLRNMMAASPLMNYADFVAELETTYKNILS